MNNTYVEPRTATIPLHEYEALIKLKENVNEFMSDDSNVLYVGWFNGYARYYSKEDFVINMSKHIKDEISYSKRIKKALDNVAKMSVFGFLRFKWSYRYTNY